MLDTIQHGIITQSSTNKMKQLDVGTLLKQEQEMVTLLVVSVYSFIYLCVCFFRLQTESFSTWLKLPPENLTFCPGNREAFYQEKNREIVSGKLQEGENLGKKKKKRYF